MACVVAMMSLLSFSATTITVDSVRQRWPWNNKVDVTYTIAGDDETATKVCKVLLTTTINGNTYAVYNPGLNVNVKPGTYTITWDDAPAGVICDTCTVKAEFYTSPSVPSGNDYMIVNLADGAISYEGVFPASASLCGVSGQKLSNARYNVDKFKTTHLALRKIPKGTYQTGDGCVNTYTTDKDYYMALFQWTNFQYWSLFDPGNEAAHGAVQITLAPRRLKVAQDARGSAIPTNAVPGTTASNYKKVIPWLNGKTGLSFDFPTELMHEIATRAGTTTTYFWGEDASLASKYAICGMSASQDVGMRLPNAWGLYDMVGNDWEWCLDVYGGTRETDDVFTPATGTDTRFPVRSGHWATAGADLKPTYRSAGYVSHPTASKNDAFAFRVAYIVPNPEE